MSKSYFLETLKKCPGSLYYILLLLCLKKLLLSVLHVENGAQVVNATAVLLSAVTVISL